MCTSDADGHDGVRAESETRLTQLDLEGKALDERDRKLSRARGLTFMATIGGGLFGLFQPSLALWGAVAVCGTIFVYFVVRHALVTTEQFELARRTKLCQQSLDRLAGKYRVPKGQEHLRGDCWVDGEHPNSSDLALFGNAALCEQLNTTQTPGGAIRLASWLMSPASRQTIEARQSAIRELSQLASLREQMSLAGMRAGKIDRDAGPFLKWATEPADYAASGGLPTMLSLALVLVTLGLFGVASALGPMWTKIWGLGIGLQVVVLLSLRPRLEPVLGPVCVKQSPLGHYGALLALAEQASFEDETLLALQRRLRDDHGTAAANMARLDRLTGLAAVRHNVLVYVLADVFLLWDVWCAWLIDRWRDAHGAQVSEWLDTLSELEALTSLATFAHEHPDFAWPVLADDAPRYQATGLGHPLIAAGDRIVNDVSLEPATPALMVTGSNMSGKSTMLRSIGINAVLAQAGAPVCAQSLRLSSMRVHTSMRVGDDLDRGASRFFMEVAKLERIVRVLEQSQDDDPALMFLLDEVLHGTNSRERNIGAKAVVRYLVEQGAVGAVSSHDLGLVELESLTDGRIVNVHFEDHIEDDTMCFDYRMKAGPVSTSNALRLMRMVGIDVPGLDADGS